MKDITILKYNKSKKPYIITESWECGYISTEIKGNKITESIYNIYGTETRKRIGKNV